MSKAKAKTTVDFTKMSNEEIQAIIAQARGVKKERSTTPTITKGTMETKNGTIELVKINGFGKPFSKTPAKMLEIVDFIIDNEAEIKAMCK